MGDFDEKNLGAPDRYFVRDILSKRVYEGDRLIKINDTIKKYRKVDVALNDILFENASYDLGGGKSVTISGKTDFVKFAKGLQGQPFYELDRHPGTHFKVYALGHGITAADLMELADNPGSDYSRAVTDRLRNLRKDFMQTVGKPDIDACQNMYVDFSKSVYDNYLAGILSCTKSLDNLEINAGLCGILGGEYSYIAQTLKYHVDEPSRDPENTKAFVQGINNKLAEQNAGYTLECMANALQLAETINQSNLDVAGNIMKNASPDSPVSRANNYIGLLANFTRFNQLVGNREIKDYFPEMTCSFTRESNFIGELVKFNSNAKFNSLPDNYMKYYLHFGETVSPENLPETYQLLDSEFTIHNLTQAEYDEYQKTKVFPKAPVNRPVKTDYKRYNPADTGLDTISEASPIAEDIFENYPVREHTEPELLPYPEPAEIEVTDSTDLDTLYAVREYNKLIEKKNDTLWVLNNLEKILYSGVTYAPDPEEPDSLITVSGENECKEFFKHFKGKPFDELCRPGQESSHLLAFCAVEGIDINDIRDMLLNPERETSQYTRERIEVAKTKLFEAGCCVDFETGMKRTEEFYVNYSRLLMDAEREFINKGDTSTSAILDMNSRFYNSQSVLIQTLNVNHTEPGSVCNRVETAVAEAFRAEGRNLTLENIGKLPGRCMGFFQNISKLNPMDPNAPDLNTRKGFSFQASMEYSRILHNDLAKFPKDADIFAREALHDRLFFERLEEESEFSLDCYDVEDNPSSFARAVNQYLRNDESAALAEAELGNLIGDPANTLSTLLGELKQWDSGFLRLRGSEKFKNIREAAETIGKTLKNTGKNISEEDCAALGEQFTTLFEATQTYLAGKKEVDMEADTNAGHRKAVADKLNTFANIGKAYFHLKEDRFIYERNQRRYAHETFLIENERKAKEGENSTLSAEANRQSEWLGEVFSSVQALDCGIPAMPQLISNAQAGYRLFGESIKKGEVPSPYKLEEAYTNIFTSLLLASEQTTDKKLVGPFSEIVRKQGTNAATYIVRDLPIVSEYVQKGREGFRSFITEKPGDIIKNIRKSLNQELNISVNSKAPVNDKSAVKSETDKVKDSNVQAKI